MKLLLALAPALLAAPAPALAQTAQQFPDRPIARAEVIAVVKRQVAAMDRNHDGVVTPAEFAAFRAHQSPAPPTGVEAIAHIGGHWFERADANGDGRVTLDEALARPLQLFDLADIDRDGVVSVKERQVAMALMSLTGQ